MNPRFLLFGGAAAAALSMSVAAQAATKPVSMGVPHVKSAQSIQTLNGDVDAFFPKKVTIHVGDTVAFAPNGFHNLDLPAKGKGPSPLNIPGDPVSGAVDAAGAPFWFNGQPSLGVNPVMFASGYGKSFTYNRKKSINSGLPLGDKLKPVDVKFTKTGTYTYYCDVHPGMKGQVKVVARTAKAPSKKADAKVVAKQLSNAVAALKRLQSTKTSAGTVQIGASAPGGVESFDFFPANPTVKVGTTVTFSMPVGSLEDHTATTGPGNPESEPDSYLGKLSGSFNGPAPSPQALYPSEQPGGTPASLTPTLHGNGFWNAGALDARAGTPQPQSNKVTFAQAGTYTFVCLIHPFMKATVTVTS